MYERAQAKGSRHRPAGGAGAVGQRWTRADHKASKSIAAHRDLARTRARQLLIDLVKVPSPQTELLEAEPLLKEFIKTAIEPRLRAMGFADIRYDGMGNLIATYGAATSGKSLMLIANAMNQPAATMPNPYGGDVVDGAKFGLPGEVRDGQGRERAESQHRRDAASPWKP